MNAAVTEGTITINGTKITMSDWKNGVVFKVLSDGKLVFTSPYSIFNIQNNYSNSKIFAVSANGIRVEAAL